MNIKELRIMTGQPQKQFAENFGIPVGTLRRWEYGESTPAPYVLKMIADKIPAKNEFMKKIESSKGTFYFDESTGTIADVRGTRIKINEDIEGVKKENLVLYAKDLFETYYEAVEKFDRDCRLDKQEDIIWG